MRNRWATNSCTEGCETTAAAIDRVVHHAIILELTGESYRTEAAKKRNLSGSGKKASTTRRSGSHEEA